MSQAKQPNYADINVNKNAGTRIEKNVIPPSKVQSNMARNIDSNKNIGSGKVIENKYTSSVRPGYEYQPGSYGVKKQSTSKVMPASNNYNVPSNNYNGRGNPPQMEVNSRPSQQISSQNYPKVPETYKKQIVSSKDPYARVERPKQTQGRKQPNIADYQFKKQDPKKYQEPSRNAPKPTVIPGQEQRPQQYRPYQPPRQYVPEPPAYQYETGVNDHQMDEELQKAIIASLGNVAISSPKNYGVSKPSKPTYKIDQIPPQLLETDMMNESFYGKQQALWQQFQKNKKRR